MSYRKVCRELRRRQDERAYVNGYVLMTYPFKRLLKRSRSIGVDPTHAAAAGAHRFGLDVTLVCIER